MDSKEFLLIAILGLSAGCASTGQLTEEMAGWQGQHLDTALAEWDEPETRRAFGDETVLIWRDRAGKLAPDGIVADNVVCERMLAVAADGSITGWRWRGDACESIDASLRGQRLAAAR